MKSTSESEFESTASVRAVELIENGVYFCLRRRQKKQCQAMFQLMMLQPVKHEGCCWYGQGRVTVQEGAIIKNINETMQNDFWARNKRITYGTEAVSRVGQAAWWHNRWQEPEGQNSYFLACGTKNVREVTIESWNRIRRRHWQARLEWRVE